jgi:aspartate/methionine/tyrosine aminotransferase
MLLARRQGIAVTPGLDFDPVSGNRFIRLSYAGTDSKPSLRALDKLDQRLSMLRR